MGKNENCSFSFPHFLVKLMVVGIFVGLAFFFILYHGEWEQETQSIEKAASTLLPGMELDALIHSKDSEQCDLFKGQWVQNSWGPPYTNNTCNFISSPSNCLKNGRPDTGYLYWSWKPYGCGIILPLDAKRFMHSMRNKAWGFIGDSIVRNQAESLVCILSQVEEPYGPYYDNVATTYYFPSHNITIVNLFVPFLVKYSTRENQELHVHLDILDEQWTTQYHKYNYVVIASGQWYLRNMVMWWEKGKIIGCHNCQEKFEEIGFAYSYTTTLRLVFKFITSNEHRPVVFFRTWTPSHFEHTEQGYICNRTKPYSEKEYRGNPVDKPLRDIEVEEFEKVVKSEVHMELFDTFQLSRLRPDGHPNRYGIYNPEKGAEVEDCLHSCLPGPVDTWNDLMMKILLRKGIVSFSENEDRSSV